MPSLFKIVGGTSNEKLSHRQIDRQTSSILYIERLYISLYHKEKNIISFFLKCYLKHHLVLAQIKNINDVHNLFINNNALFSFSAWLQALITWYVQLLIFSNNISRNNLAENLADKAQKQYQTVYSVLTMRFIWLVCFFVFIFLWLVKVLHIISCQKIIFGCNKFGGKNNDLMTSILLIKS